MLKVYFYNLISSDKLPIISYIVCSTSRTEEWYCLPKIAQL